VKRTQFLLEQAARMQERAGDDEDTTRIATETGILRNGYWRLIELGRVVVESHRDLVDREPPSDGNYPPELIMALWILGIDVKDDLRRLLREHGGADVDMDGLGD
jgi:hypothetical protein